MPNSTTGALSVNNPIEPHTLSINERRVMSVTSLLKLATKTVYEADILVRQLRVQSPEFIPATEALRAQTSKTLASLLRAIDESRAVREVMS